MDRWFCRAITACRFCGSDRFDDLLDFGELCISDFLPANELGMKAPLRIIRCGACGLVQNRHTINPDYLFPHYWYRSGTNEHMRSALADVVMAAQREVELKSGDAVLDIGANDDTLLANYPERMVTKYAVDPSTNVPHLCNNDSTVHLQVCWPYFWGFSLPRFKIITTIASGLYHTDDPNAFVAAIKKHLHPDGVWIVQFQDAEAVLDHFMVDYFCHEHVTLWDHASFQALIARHGLRIREGGISRNDTNGDSIRYVVEHGDSPIGPPADYKVLWEGFYKRAQDWRLEVRAFFENGQELGKTLMGVAASTKANTVLQWCGVPVGPGGLEAIVDIAPEKQGLYTVGSRIPIIGEEEAAKREPDLYVALAWHFLDGLRARSPEKPFAVLLPALKVYPPLNGWLGSAKEASVAGLSA